MVMDSLRYWVTEFHVDGFRFDLGATLGREDHGFDPGSGFFDAIRQDPVLSQREADLRAVGHRPGRLPARQSSARLRRMERPLPRRRAPLLARRRGHARRTSPRGWPARPTCSTIAGGGPGPRSTTSPRTTASPCATWSATTSKHNEANGEDNRDGHDDNPAATGASKGRPTIRRSSHTRGALQRAMLATRVPRARHADAAGRRRVRPHPERQQQRLLPGQRDLLARLDAGRDRRRASALIDFVARAASRCASDTPCCAPPLPARQRRAGAGHARHRLVRRARQAR